MASYAWTFGDGGTATGPAPAHTYAGAGDYPVTLTVTDDGGLTNTAAATVTVTPPPAPEALGLRGLGGYGGPPGDVGLGRRARRPSQAGDGLVLVLGTNSDVTGTAPDGWVLAATQTDGGKMTTQVFSRVATAADAGSAVKVGVGTVPSSLTLQLMAYSGTATTGPVALGHRRGRWERDVAHDAPRRRTGRQLGPVDLADKSSTARQFLAPAGLAERSNLAGMGNGDLATLVADTGAPVAAGQVGGLTATVTTASSRSTMLTVVLLPLA